MKIFVAGGTGVIGRRAVRGLVEAGHDVTVSSRSKSNDIRIDALGGRPVRSDLFDRASLESAVSGCEVVISLATRIPPMSRALRRSSWEQNDRIRTLGSANLVRAALTSGSARYIQESITFSYLDHGSAWIDEEGAVSPSPVTASALEAEKSADRFTREGGAGVVLRFGAFYAPDADHTRAFVEMARKGWSPTMGPPSAYQSFIHADDAAAAVLAALHLPAGIYNVADDEPLTRAEFADIVAQSVGRARLRQIPQWFMKAIGGANARLLMRSQRVSSRKLRTATSWHPGYRTLRTGWPEVCAAAADFEADRAA